MRAVKSPEIKADSVVCVLCIAFLVVALAMIALTPPATQYEIDIYVAYPVYLWALFAAVYALAVTLSLRHCAGSLDLGRGAIGLGSILVVNTTILLLPTVRQYYYYGWTDPAQFYGLLKDVSLYGSIGGPAGMTSYRTWAPLQNIFPASTIVIIAVSRLADIPLNLTTMVTPVFMFLFYQLSMFMLARSLTHNASAAFLVSLFASPMLFLWLQSMSAPTVPLFLYSPFLFYIAVQTGRSERILVGATVLSTVALWHPVDAFSIVVVLICFQMVRRIYKKRDAPGILPLLILVITWIAWLLSLNAFDVNLHRFYTWWIAPDLARLEISTYLLTLERAHASIFDLMDAIFRQFGHQILYFFLSGAILLSFLIRGRKHKMPFELAFSLLITVIFVLLTLVFFMLPVIGSFRRALFYAVAGATLVNGLHSFTWLQRKRRRKVYAVFLVAIVCASMIVGMLNVHYSPFTKGYNQQISRAELDGMDWFLSHDNEKILADQVRVLQYGLSAILLGVRATPLNIRWGPSETYQAPDHFGYDRHEHYGQSLREDRYFLSNTLDEIYLPVVFPMYKDYWRWSTQDWTQLENNDSSVLRIYDNTGFRVFYVMGSGR